MNKLIRIILSLAIAASILISINHIRAAEAAWTQYMFQGTGGISWTSPNQVAGRISANTDLVARKIGVLVYVSSPRSSDLRVGIRNSSGSLITTAYLPTTYFETTGDQVIWLDITPTALSSGSDYYVCALSSNLYLRTWNTGASNYFIESTTKILSLEATYTDTGWVVPSSMHPTYNAGIGIEATMNQSPSVSATNPTVNQTVS